MSSLHKVKDSSLLGLLLNNNIILYVYSGLPTGTELAEASPLSVAAYQVDSKIQDAIEGLQRDFRQRVSTMRISLIDTTSAAAIKELLRELPAGEVKDQVGYLLSKNYSLIMSSDDIDQLFLHLSSLQAWDFLHPQLLEYLVQELGDYETKKIMREYKSLLIQFRSTTKMRELSGWFGEISETSEFKKVVLSLGDNWEDKTYEEFEALRVSLLRQQIFFRSSLHLCGVLTGSILVALAVSDVTHEILMLRWEGNFLNFSRDAFNEISAVYVEERCLIRKVYELPNPGIPTPNADSPEPTKKKSTSS